MLHLRLLQIARIANCKCCLEQLKKQAGAELCQAQVKLKVVVEIGVELGVEVEACPY